MTEEERAVRRRLFHAIRRAVRTGNEDIYYDSDFDSPDRVSPTTRKVEAHEYALLELDSALDAFLAQTRKRK